MRWNSYRSEEMVSKDMTTTQAVAYWYRWAKAGGIADHTADQYSSMVQDFFRHSGREFYDVAIDDLVDWAEALNQRGPTVAACGRKALNNFWSWLRANGLDDRAITDFMPVSEPRAKIPSAFTPEELRRLWAAAESNPRQITFFKMLYFTGARRSEALTLLSPDLSPSGVTLRNTKRSSTGGGAERFIPFGPAAGTELCDLAEKIRKPGDDRVFPFARGIVADWCSNLSLELGIHVHPHKFRATFATTLLSRGIDIRTVQELLGHRDIKTTMRYLAVTDERKYSAVSVL